MLPNIKNTALLESQPNTQDDLNVSEKLIYQKPSIQTLGTVSSITQNGSSGVLESSNGYLTGS